MALSAGAGASGWYWCLYWCQCPVLAVVTVHGTTAVCVVSSVHCVVLLPVHNTSAHAGAGIHCLVPESVSSGWYQWLVLVPGARWSVLLVLPGTQCPVPPAQCPVPGTGAHFLVSPGWCQCPV